jgi:uncharacterized protein (DUF1778 family)
MQRKQKQIMLSEGERALIEQAARIVGEPAGTFIRVAAIARAKEKVSENEERFGGDIFDITKEKR